jgi:hypothetical protein
MLTGRNFGIAGENCEGSRDAHGSYWSGIAGNAAASAGCSSTKNLLSLSFLRILRDVPKFTAQNRIPNRDACPSKCCRGVIIFESICQQGCSKTKGSKGRLSYFAAYDGAEQSQVLTHRKTLPLSPSAL